MTWYSNCTPLNSEVYHRSTLRLLRGVPQDGVSHRPRQSRLIRLCKFPKNSLDDNCTPLKTIIILENFRCVILNLGTCIIHIHTLLSRFSYPCGSCTSYTFLSSPWDSWCLGKYIEIPDCSLNSGKRNLSIRYCVFCTSICLM